MKVLSKLPLGGLTPAQAATVTGVFALTLIGAIALAVVFRWWNAR